jgi:hypothetical protein
MVSKHALVVLSMLSVACPACGGPQTSPATAAAQAVASVQSRLAAGPWRLVDYRPQVQLDPVMQGLLALQLHAMLITFDGTTLAGQSPTFNLRRPYTIENVTAFEFDLVSPDPQGGGRMRSHCLLSDDGRHLTFQAMTDPWNGTGTLER